MKTFRSVIIVSVFCCLLANPYAIFLYFAFSSANYGGNVLVPILQLLIGNSIINYTLYRFFVNNRILNFSSILKWTLIPYSIVLIMPILEIGYIVSNIEFNTMLSEASRLEMVQLLSTTVMYTALAYVIHILVATTVHYLIMKKKYGNCLQAEV